MSMRIRSKRGRRLVAALTVGALALTAVACDRNDSNDSLSATYGVPDNAVDIQAEEWKLVSVGTSVELARGTNVTLSVDGDRVFGQGPCNRYHGTIEFDDDDSVAISKLASTQKACEDPVMRAEQAYLDALGRVDTIDVSDEELELSGGGATLVYEPLG
jgi:heat shock protein HslJ